MDTNAFPKYWHLYEDGRCFREIWLREHGVRYFTGRDNAALQYLPRLLGKPDARA